MSEPLSIVVHGAAGRMGRAIVRLALAEPARFRVAAAVVSGASALCGKPLRDEFGAAAGALVFAEAADVAADAIVDFSSPDGFDAALQGALARRVAFVSGTTGLSPVQHDSLRRAAATIPVLWSANFSIGVALLMQLAGVSARTLGDWDCEIVEMHHRHKKDAPSGTALALGRMIAAARGVDFDEVARLDRSASMRRDAGEIGFTAARGGDVVGEHTIVFASEGERVELVHRATDRDIFARGALRAAAWLRGRAPGLHAMADVLSG